jgi:hypothetical protein
MNEEMMKKTDKESSKVKKGFLKPAVLIGVLAITLILSIFYISGVDKNQDDTFRGKEPSVPGTPTLIPVVSLAEFVSEEGKYIIRYPRGYTLNKTINPVRTILSSNMNDDRLNFKLTISHKYIDSDLTLGELIDQFPLCEKVDSNSGIAGTINGEKQAQLYTDAICGDTVQTVIYSLNNSYFYIMTVESAAKFSEIKPYVDTIFSNFEFIESTISPTESVVCANDARECTDGTWVGRSGPNCQFVCPSQ